MKHTLSWRWPEMALLIVILLLLILIVSVLASRIVPVPFGSGVSPAKTGSTETIAAQGYTTVFTFAENAAATIKDFQQHFLLHVGLLLGGSIGLLFGGALLIYSLIFRPKFRPGGYVALGGLALILVGLGGLNIAINSKSVSNCARLQSSYDSQQYRITEGIVHVLSVQAVSGHGRVDSVRVGNVSFEVDYFLSTCAYRQSIAHGGVLTEGTHARIYYTDYRTILRIDMKKQ